MHKQIQVNGLTLNYIDEGEGPVVQLLHGFASNLEMNWVGPRWVEKLTKAGFRVVAHDHRGHGKSDKLYEPPLYEATYMAADAAGLLTALGISKAHVMGYSMGARIAAFMALNSPELVHSAVFSGLASGIVHGVGGSDVIAQALEAESIDDVDDQMGKRFRKFAELTKGDLKALAACIKISRVKIKAEALERLTLPVLIAAGTDDDISGRPEDLQAYIPHAEVLHIEGKDHMTAVGAPEHQRGVIDFLQTKS